MHNNYYFLRQLSFAIQQQVSGMSLSEAFSQNKDELILGFTSSTETFYIKAHLRSDFCCLHFPIDHQRARRNSIDLFTEIIDKKVLKIRQFLNERCFAIVFNDDFLLLFKMHGNRSNIILYKNNTILSIFKHKLKNDWNIQIDKIDRTIDQSDEALLKHANEHKILFPTFGKVIEKYFSEHKYVVSSIENKIFILKNTLSYLSDNKYYILNINKKIVLSLVPFDNLIEEFDSPIQAINTFFNYYIKNNSIEKEKSKIVNHLRSMIAKIKAYIDNTSTKLHKQSKNKYDQVADLLMANLHKASTHSKEIVLDNFYDEMKPICIKLKPTLSLQKNAEIYYRKAKNQQKELNKLNENIIFKKEKLTQLVDQLERVQLIDNVKNLRSFTKENSLLQSNPSQKVQTNPYYIFQKNNFTIWVGKNAKHNDTLTQKLTHKNDLWLHAKDVSGSHVVIKHQSGRAFPQPVIEYAAQLAAYYSKRKTDSLCPVIYTPKKYVRKVKGSPAGAVVVDKKQVILVEPIRV